MRIRNKILLTTCFLILLSLLMQIIFNQYLSKEYFLNQQNEIISEAFEQIKSAYENDLEQVNEIAEALQDKYGIKTIVMKKGEVIYSSGYSFKLYDQKPGMNMPFDDFKFSKKPAVHRINDLAVFGEEERLQLSGKFYYEGEEINVLLTLQVESIDNSIAVFTKANLMISSVVLLVGVLIALVVSKTISSPIIEIESVSKKIAQFDFSSVANEEESTIELSSLAKNINLMSRKLDESMCELTMANEQLKQDIEYRKKIEEYRREFIAGVSHEMKTPLALLQVYTELLDQHVENVDKEEYCKVILEETEKLNRLVTDMLEVSSLDNGFIKLSFEDINLTELCKEILNEYVPILNDYQISFQLSDGIIVSGDKKYLEQVVKNILNNAIQHTFFGHRIHIELKREDKQCVLSIYNEGERIPDEDLEHLWDAFYRTDKARTRDEKNNVGLGLYIVKTVIDKHQGSCKIDNKEDGVELTVTLALK